MKFLTVLLFLLSGSAYGAGNVTGENPWVKLERQCEVDFPAFEKSLDALRKDFTFEISRMSQKQYTELDLKSDPRLIFIALSWPSDLSDKDEFWKANQDCANVHWDARKALRSIVSERTEKKARVEDLKNCVLTRFNRTHIVAPFDQLLRCYEKRASAN